jgi:hypothetical protein
MGDDSNVKSVGVAWRYSGVCYVENKAEEAGADVILLMTYVLFLVSWCSEASVGWM